jgi:hypothetical protein
MESEANLARPVHCLSVFSVALRLLQSRLAADNQTTYLS